MKKYVTKPVLAVVAAAAIIGGVTPFLANASSIASPSATKVVMNDEGKQVTRYNLKELAKNDPTTLNMLLKNQADHLYIIVDSIHLNTKLQTYMEENKEEWERIYNQYYSEIWLEVRFAEAKEEIVSVSAQTKDNKVYIRGIVTPEVTKVVVTKPDGGTIDVVPTSEHSFTVTFAALGSVTKQYVTINAYAGKTLVDSEKVELIPQAVEEAHMILHTVTVLDAKKEELKIKGVVKQGADKVYVTYNGEKKEAGVKKLWDGVGSFSATLKNVAPGADKALVELYKNGKKIDSASVDVEVVNAPAKEEEKAYAITGTAVLDPKNKMVQVKGSIAGWSKKDKTKLVVLAPDGKKQEVKPNDKGEFEIKLSFKNRSYSAKTVHFELYQEDKLVKQADIFHSTKVVVKPGDHDDDHDDDDKDKKEKKEKGKEKDNHPNGNAYGYWKKHDQNWDGQNDDDNKERDHKERGK
ncbi:hypothetical protein BRE01_42750 [Brevibacillus reuszeri]|uniref:Bacterial Ig domain-containing protein n=1 Tax=Brevibacillus reuszeri TaxID=54915 RepID=A0A0K9YUN6_9BACL|nr:hypothetical protein [Brevibacillus reuszeri]KNB72423.1 hypothetical protein ADS79_11145 [Brevibacillus reuszeri]MED1860912.1 hypothetical protein [Brevibacillus reuszeri]GED70573.1 hypothetical protein BRE01_42750 [Brevibacillus reuszeri]